MMQVLTEIYALIQKTPEVFCQKHKIPILFWSETLLQCFNHLFSLFFLLFILNPPFLNLSNFNLKHLWKLKKKQKNLKGEIKARSNICFSFWRVISLSFWDWIWKI
jgi:hypothetical protein